MSPAPTSTEPGTAPHDVAGRLAAADRARDGDPPGPAWATAVYAELADAIDPATPDGHARLGWLVNSGVFLDERLEDLLRRGARSALDANLRLACDVFAYQFPFRRGDFAGARELLLAACRRLRGTGAPAEAGAVSNLARVYLEQGREFETMVVARAAVRLAGRFPVGLTTGVAYARLCAALRQLRDWDELEEAAARLERLAPELEDRHARLALRTVSLARSDIRFARGDSEGTLAELDRAHAVPPPSGSAEEDAFDRALLVARIAMRRGDLAAAADALTSPAIECDPGPARALRRAVARYALARRRGTDGEGEADDLLQALSGPSGGRTGLSQRLDAACSATRLAAGSPLAGAFSRIGARLAIARAVELREASATLAEFAEPDATDLERLARYRARFIEENRDVYDGIAELARQGVPVPFFEELVRDGHVSVCAWCLDVQLPDGRSLPVGHLLPDGGPVALSHGICARCATSVDVPRPVL